MKIRFCDQDIMKIYFSTSIYLVYLSEFKDYEITNVSHVLSQIKLTLKHVS